MTMCLEGAVLHMRDPLTPQPLVGSGGDALLWNGEVFAGLKVTCKCIHSNSGVVHASDPLRPTTLQSGMSGSAEACVVRGKSIYIYPLTLSKDYKSAAFITSYLTTANFTLYTHYV